MRRRWWIAGGIVLALPVAALAAAHALLDGDALRARLEAAVTEATGRRFTLTGPVSLKLSLVPTVVLEGPSLANAATGSRPAMLTARSVEAEVALLPLLRHRVEVRRLVLDAPDLLLERDAAGHPNWQLDRPAIPAAAPPDAPTTPAVAPGGPTAGRPATARATIPAPDGGTGWEVVLHELVLRDGRLAWIDHPGARAEALALPELDLSTDAEDATLRATGTLAARGLTLSLEARGGTLASLLHRPPGIPAPWPFRAALRAEGLSATVEGALAAPGWQASLSVAVDRLARLTPALAPALFASQADAPQAPNPSPGPTLPEARDITFKGELSPAGLGEAQLNAASLDLSGTVRGLRLTDVRLYAPRAGAPAAASGSAVLHALPLRWNAALPAVDALRRPPAAANPWPLRLSVEGDALALTAEGKLTAPGLGGGALQLDARAADLAQLGSLAGTPLPGLRDVTTSAQLSAADGTLTLGNWGLHAAQLQGGGTLRLRPGLVPVLDGALRFSDLDLDAIAPPLPAVAAAPADSAAAPPRTQSASGSAPGSSAPQPPTAAPRGRRVIPDVALPFAALRRLEADLSLVVTRLRAGGLDWQDGEATLALHGGQLRLAPVRVTGAGGSITAEASADAASSPPALALRLSAPSLDLGTISAASDLGGGLAGTLEAEAALRARGTTLPELAATLDGPLSLALANGRVDLRLLDRLGGDLRRLLLPNAPANGAEAIRCLALRLEAEAGVARARAMLLETDIASVLGAGTVDLRQERLDLRLLPRARIGGLGLTIPVIVDGALGAPRLRADASGAAAAGGAILQDLLGNASADGGSCAAQLRIARGGREGAVPEPATGNRAATNMGDLLRGLLGR